MDDLLNGPCLSHCFKCPYGVVVASNLALSITFALIVTIILNIKQEELIASLTPEQREKFASAQLNTLKTFVCALLLGISGMLLWKPFTLFKMA
tara:strand:- start:423 stop:704 length:282 start_codon:yes stop_codon:yes gene_type:complete